MWKQRGINLATSGSGWISRFFGIMDKIHRTDSATRLYFHPVHGVATCFVSSSRRWTALTWSQPGGGGNLIKPLKSKGLVVRGVWGVFLAVIPEEAVKHEKANETKINKQPNKKPWAPISKTNCYTELSVPFVTPGATVFIFDLIWIFFFLMLKLFVFSFWFCFVFLNYSSFEPHKNGSVAPGSPPEGRKNSLAMYKKKSKLNQKCCSWCLFYTVVLLAFLLL